MQELTTVPDLPLTAPITRTLRIGKGFEIGALGKNTLLDAVGRRHVRAGRDRGELPLLDSGADMRKPAEAFYGTNTMLTINSALLYCVNCFNISQV